MNARINSHNWQGKVQTRRESCPKCGKRGLGPIKSHQICVLVGRPAVSLVGQQCRYCRHWQSC